MKVRAGETSLKRLLTSRLTVNKISIAYSKNGINWTGISDSALLIGFASCVAYSEIQKLWVVSGSGGSFGTVNTFAYSKNGIVWTSVPFQSDSAGYALAYSMYNNIWVSGISSVSGFMYSTDGFNWTTLPATKNISSVINWIACNNL